MPDLDAFEAEVKAKIKQLSAKDAATRRKAAAWLGEAGDPTAITSLAQAYKNDADPRVKEAAGYSLGMFRKLEQELEGDDSEVAVALLEKVALEGKMGGRPRIAKRALVKLELGLLLSAILVAALAFVLPGVLKGGGAASSVETPIDGTTPVASGVDSVPDKDRAVIVGELRGAWTQLNNNATKLQTQYQTVLGGSTFNCSEFFDALTPTALSVSNAEQFPELATISRDINQAQTDLTAAKAAYDRVCFQSETLSAGDFGGPMGATVGVVMNLPVIETALTAAEASATGATVVPDQVVPTIEPTTASSTVDLRPHLIALQNIIDNVTATNGAFKLLQQYWTEAASAGGTQGCSYLIDVATIPANYELPAEIAPAAPTLRVSTDLVNTGLQAVRDGWQTFSLACSANTLSQYAADSVLRMDAAQQAFDNASRQIAGLRGS
jgi:hypothetical protein